MAVLRTTAPVSSRLKTNFSNPGRKDHELQCHFPRSDKSLARNGEFPFDNQRTLAAHWTITSKGGDCSKTKAASNFGVNYRFPSLSTGNCAVHESIQGK
jgi:hypothetical protein